jgi:flagella basal body P-ring formation protein FlgA
MNRTLARLAVALTSIAFGTGVAAAEPLAAVARTRIEATLPANLAVGELHFTARLAALDVEPSMVAIEWPRPPRAGTSNVRVRWAGTQTRFVPVTIAAKATVAVAVRDLAPGEPITAADIRLEDRPLAAGFAPAPHAIGLTTTTAISAGSIVAASAVIRPAPIARGTAVTIEVRRPGLRVTGHGTLERAARPGELALVRVAADRPPITGTLTAGNRVLVGEVTP